MESEKTVRCRLTRLKSGHQLLASISTRHNQNSTFISLIKASKERVILIIGHTLQLFHLNTYILFR